MAEIRSGPLLVVSPHLDDAVLSCFALLERGEAVDVLTVCAGAPDPPRRGWWDEDCGFASSAESIPARFREDEEAFAGTLHRRRYLALLELQYVDGARGEREAQAIVDAVGAWLVEHPAGLVALPAGAGCRSQTLVRRLRRLVGRPCHPPQHPDHLFVRNAALSALAHETPALLYEELPYLLGGGADAEAERHARSGGCELEPLVIAIDRVAKAARIAAYASQVAPLSPPEGRLDDPETIPGEERYWLLRRKRVSGA
jgi:LmbE family N-acetylglucosaminyl deacetylase